MCQLTFINLNDRDMNRLAATAMGVLNSESPNNDGVGIFQNKPDEEGFNIFKSHVDPKRMLNWGILTNGIVSDNSPVLMHVRNATAWGSSYTRTISDEKAHPFESSSGEFIIAHNGTLEPKDDEVTEKYEKTDLIDTEVFLAELDIEYEKNGGDIKKALTSTMKEFTGKFAFLIFSRKEDKFYVVRGKTKTLYKVPYHLAKKDDTPGKQIGYVINTERTHLDKSLMLVTNLIGADSKKYVIARSKDIELLPAETIMEVVPGNMELKVCGKIEENDKPVAASTNTVNKGNYRNFQGRSHIDDKDTVETYEAKLAKDILIMLHECNLTITELDVLCQKYFSTPLFNLNEEDFSHLIDEVFPTLTENYSVIKSNHWKESKSKMYNQDIMLLYEIGGIQFPFMLNPTAELQSLAQDMKEMTKYGTVMEH